MVVGVIWRVLGTLSRHQIRTVSTMSESLDAFFAPPLSVRGAKELDRSAFKREVELPAVKLDQASSCGKFLKRLSHVLLVYPSLKKVRDLRDEESGKITKMILLTPEQCRKTPLSSEDHQWIVDNGGEEITQNISLDYSFYSNYSILRAILPPEVVEVPTGFETVGHIAHLNLREEALPYKKIIGEVLVDKQSNIRTVVNKTDSIDNTFRFFKMELLAGDDNLVATVKENECSFTFDFSKVYWNSRLKEEHKRVVDMLTRNDIVLDMFAGVGPFAVPAAKKGCMVYANDLNPHSYTYLCENAKKNKVTHKLTAFNMDGREFVKTVTKDLIKKTFPEAEEEVAPSSSNLQPERKLFTHVVMNLPASAVEFLDTFKGLFSTIPKHLHNVVKLPTVYCYCFVKYFPNRDPEHPAITVAKYLGISSLKEGTYSVFTVRHVAPNKDMIRVSFEVPPDVIFGESPVAVDDKNGIPGSALSKAEGSDSVGIGDEPPAPKKTRLCD